MPNSKSPIDPLAAPGTLARLLRARDSHPDPAIRSAAVNFLDDLKQFRKAEEGARVVPRPFAARTPCDPHRAPGTPGHESAKQIVAAYDREALLSGLQAQMGTDADRPPSPPTLRDQIEAAAAIHAPQEN